MRFSELRALLRGSLPLPAACVHEDLVISLGGAVSRLRRESCGLADPGTLFPQPGLGMLSPGLSSPASTDLPSLSLHRPESWEAEENTRGLDTPVECMDGWDPSGQLCRDSDLTVSRGPFPSSCLPGVALGPASPHLLLRHTKNLLPQALCMCSLLPGRDLSRSVLVRRQILNECELLFFL